MLHPEIRVVDCMDRSSARACSKNHSRHLYNDAIASYSPLCVIFAPHSVDVTRYASFIWHKSPTNCDVHLTESIFQTRSRGTSISMTRRAPLCGLFSLHGAAQTSREDVPCSPRRHLSAFADIFPLGARVHKNTGSEHVIRSLPVMTDLFLLSAGSFYAFVCL